MATKQNWKREAAEWIFATIIFLMFAFMLYALVVVLQDPNKGVKSSEAAGWVQAIGSVAAIFAAVWISNSQHRKQMVRDQQDLMQRERGYLITIHAELDTLMKSAERNIGGLLDQLDDDRALLHIFPVPANPFKIFDAQIPSLALVRDTALRAQIIRTYAKAMGVVNTFRLNNDIIKEVESFRVAHALNSDPDVLREHQNAMNVAIQYGRGLREMWGELRIEVTALLAALPRE